MVFSFPALLLVRINSNFNCNCMAMSSYASSFLNVKLLIMQFGDIEEKKITFNYPPLYLHNYIKAKLSGMDLGWSPFKIVSINLNLHSRFPLLLKIRWCISESVWNNKSISSAVTCSFMSFYILC